MPDASSEEPLARSAQQRLNAQLAELREKLDPEVGLEDRLWSALARSVSLFERRLTSAEQQADEASLHFVDVESDAAAIRQVAETLDRLGLLKPPPPPVEAPEPDTSEVWIAAGDVGLSVEQCDAIVARLCERYEGRA